MKLHRAYDRKCIFIITFKNSIIHEERKNRVGREPEPQGFFLRHILTMERRCLMLIEY
jgi:hypothetical protein